MVENHMVIGLNKALDDKYAEEEEVPEMDWTQIREERELREGR